MNIRPASTATLLATGWQISLVALLLSSCVSTGNESDQSSTTNSGNTNNTSESNGNSAQGESERKFVIKSYKEIREAERASEAAKQQRAAAQERTAKQNAEQSNSEADTSSDVTELSEDESLKIAQANLDAGAEDTSQTAVAVTEQNDTEPNVETADLVDIEEQILPQTFSFWTLDQVAGVGGQSVECVLTSAPTKMQDGYDSTRLSIRATTTKLSISTESNIDLSYEGSGLQFGNGERQPFSTLSNDTTAEINGDWTDSLVNADRLTVFLGFWPTWPKTELQSASVSLEDMKLAVPALRECQNLGSN